MSFYSQYLNDETKWGCSLTTLFNILLYRYAIEIKLTFLVKTAIFFEKLWLYNRKTGATFDIIYNAFVNNLNKQTWLKFKIFTNKITNLKKSDKRTYWIGIKKYTSYRFDKSLVNWEFTKESVDYMLQHNGSGHNFAFDWDAWGYWINTRWKPNNPMTYETLKYWQEKWLFRDNIRTIYPDSEETKQVCHLCIRMFQAEKKNKLDNYLEMNKNNKYLEKAKKLYFIGK